jgi:hypothetical protein
MYYEVVHIAGDPCLSASRLRRATTLVQRHGVVTLPTLGKAFGMQRAYALPDEVMFRESPSLPVQVICVVVAGALPQSVPS